MLINSDDFKNLLTVSVEISESVADAAQDLIQDFRSYANVYIASMRELGGILVDDSKIVNLSLEMCLPVDECLHQAIVDNAYDAWIDFSGDRMSVDERELSEMMLVTPFTEEHRYEKAKLH